MKIDHILKESRLTLPLISQKAGVALGYLKQLSAGNAEAGNGTREKIAAFLEQHADALREYSRQLRKG